MVPGSAKSKEINRLKEDNRSLGKQLAEAKDKDDEEKNEVTDKLTKLQATLKAKNAEVRKLTVEKDKTLEREGDLVSKLTDAENKVEEYKIINLKLSSMNKKLSEIC